MMSNEYWARKALKLIVDAYPDLKLSPTIAPSVLVIAVTDPVLTVSLQPNDDYLPKFKSALEAA